jgi:hypothetical protein
VGVSFDVIGFAGPNGENPQGRVFLGGRIYRNSGGPLTCAKVRGRLAVGGFRIETSDDPSYIGKGLIIHGQDNGRAPADRAVDRGNAIVVPEPPTTCPEPDARQASVDLCGDLTIRDAKAGSPPFVRRLKVRQPKSRPCSFTPASPAPVVAPLPAPGPQS